MAVVMTLQFSKQIAEKNLLVKQGRGWGEREEKRFKWLNIRRLNYNPLRVVSKYASFVVGDSTNAATTNTKCVVQSVRLCYEQLQKRLKALTTLGFSTLLVGACVREWRCSLSWYISMKVHRLLVNLWKLLQHAYRIQWCWCQNVPKFWHSDVICILVYVHIHQQVT